MLKLSYWIKRAAEPSSWVAITFLLGLLGVPAPLLALLHQVLNLAPDVINTLATLSAGAVAVALPEVQAASVPAPDFPMP